MAVHGPTGGMRFAIPPYACWGREGRFPPCRNAPERLSRRCGRRLAGARGRGSCRAGSRFGGNGEVRAVGCRAGVWVWMAGMAESASLLYRRFAMFGGVAGRSQHGQL